MSGKSNNQTQAVSEPVSDFKDLFKDGQLMLSVMKPLLKDHTTGKYIVFATDTYEENGGYYHKERQMFPDFVRSIIMNGILLPRIQKTAVQQKLRTRWKAEVFTPSWICNKMNNFCDTEWFGRENVFNVENEDYTWTVNESLIEFPKSRSKRVVPWQEYVESRRIEIACGEAPFLVSRYDTTSGESFPIQKRIGILDRKLRAVNENAKTDSEWEKWAERAFQSCYGFEYQGDSLFFARVNLMQTYIDYYTERFGNKPAAKKCEKIAGIISWNLWQMDAFQDACPFGVPQDQLMENQAWDMMPLFEDLLDQPVPECIEPVYCKIRDWRANVSIEFRDLKKWSANE